LGTGVKGGSGAPLCAVSVGMDDQKKEKMNEEEYKMAGNAKT
jgi:hypothetical protein